MLRVTDLLEKLGRHSNSSTSPMKPLLNIMITVDSIAIMTRHLALSQSIQLLLRLPTYISRYLS